MAFALVSCFVLLTLCFVSVGTDRLPAGLALEEYRCIDATCYRQLSHANCVRDKQGRLICVCDRDFAWSPRQDQCKEEKGATTRLADPKAVCVDGLCFVNATEAGYQCADQRRHRGRCCAAGSEARGERCVASSRAVRYDEACEDAMNELIGVHLSAAHKYLFMSWSLSRASVSYPGSSRFFGALSTSQRALAKLLIAYQNKRGGVVELRSVNVSNPRKWDDVSHPYEAVLLSLKEESVAKNAALLEAYSQCDDSQTQQFLEDHPMEDNVHVVKRLADMFRTIDRLRQTGSDGVSGDSSLLGEYLFDRSLLESAL